MDTDTKAKEESPAEGSKPLSAWEKPRFQRFALIIMGAGLLLSLVAVLSLKASVDSLTHQKMPYIQDQLDKSQVR